ncbi:FmdB family zinc ribbon protein [Ornithinimicrobium cavernae]|uniref:FmdB family zinc ribbon protein n=1 Tax=Ornithinimicrobium cavernae TaxID=2666047 RepID=UPI000D69D30E|nr:FmdB family zinc ribbon protein [Ornithinimicrobium cavernae]
MPTYSYACKECDNAFDIQQAFSDDALTVCAECGGTLRKRYGSVGVVFKGSGFYRTDSRNGSVPPSPAKTAADSASGGSSTGGSSTGSSSSGSSSSGGSGGAGSSSSTGGSSGSSASTGSSKAAASA